MSSLDEFKRTLDELASKETGQLTREQAFNRGVCKCCKIPPVFYSYAGRKEYSISGLCEPCFDLIMTHSDDNCQICELPEEFHKYGIIGKTHRFIQKPMGDD